MIPYKENLYECRLPYNGYKAGKSGRRKLSKCQQKIYDSMPDGVWCTIDKERLESLNSMVHKGWVITARLKLLEEHKLEDVLLDLIFGKLTNGQPLVLYRKDQPKGRSGGMSDPHQNTHVSKSG